MTDCKRSSYANGIAYEDVDKSLLLALRFKRYKEARRAIERNVSLRTPRNVQNSLE